MKEKFSRYTFTFLEAIDSSSLAKLMALSDKIFIFLPNNIQAVPIPLVLLAQRKGKDLKWVTTTSENTLQSTLSFSLGVWHERAPIEIEFVVASNEESLDPFIAFINAVGRKCLRVNLTEPLEINKVVSKINEKHPIVANYTTV
jgi:hypothetical protein